MNHYFTSEGDLKENKEIFDYKIQNHTITLESNSGMFSPGHVDYATDILLNNLPSLSGTVLDLGCGYGVIGIALSKINNITATLADINPRALACARDNCARNGVTTEIIESDCFQSIDDHFDNIILNPPIHAGKQLMFQMYEDSHNHLNQNGTLYIIIQKKHGAESTIKELTNIFGNCTELYKKKGFYILASRK